MTRLKPATMALLAVFAVAGCQSSEPAPAQPVAVAPVVREATVDKPGTTDPTKIGIVLGKKPVITVGYHTPERALDLFHDPGQFGAEFDDLPAKFEWPYRARTWEMGHSGFGEITYEGLLVAAMYQESNVKQDRVDELIEAHRAQVDLLPVEITGKKVSYWFWDKDKQRLMICAYENGQKGIQLTIAMGDDVVMDALGIGPDFAHRDIARISGMPDKLPPVPAPPAKPQN